MEPAPERPAARATTTGAARDLLGLRLAQLGSLVNFIFFRFLIGTVEALDDLGLLAVNRRADWRQARRVRPRMVNDIVAERVMIFVTRDFDCLGRFKAHVVPAEIFKAAADLAETLGTHRGTRRTLAGEKTGGKRGERLGFSGHHQPPLLTDDAATEAADRPGSCDNRTRLRTRRSEDSTAEVLFEAIRDIFPELGDFLGRPAARVDFHHGAAVDHRGREIGAMVDRDRRHGAVLRQSDRGFVGNLGLRRRRVDDEDERLSPGLAPVARDSPRQERSTR